MLGPGGLRLICGGCEDQPAPTVCSEFAKAGDSRLNLPWIVWVNRTASTAEQKQSKSVVFIGLIQFLNRGIYLFYGCRTKTFGIFESLDFSFRIEIAEMRFSTVGNQKIDRLDFANSRFGIPAC